MKAADSRADDPIVRGGTITVAEMVLVAMADAADWTTSPVPDGAIVVRAWKMFPTHFGLLGYPEFPDASDIHKPLYRTLRQRGLVESLGQKTFRLTELGLNSARSVVSSNDQTPVWRRTVQIDICGQETTESMIGVLLDAAGQDVEAVANRLVASILSMRYPGREPPWDAEGEREQLRVGGTTFAVFIPTTLEMLGLWVVAQRSEGRRVLLVRDAALSFVRRILADSEQAVPTTASGIESFVGQMIEGVAAYDSAQIAETVRTVVDRYNDGLPLTLPRIRLNYSDIRT